MNIIVTGAAGFIGFHLCKNLLENGFLVIGFDNYNNYYNPKLKKDRVKELNNISTITKNNFFFIEGNLENHKDVKKIFNNKYYDQESKCSLVHLAAQAGVRYSIENPSAYIQSNLVGFANIIEECKLNKIEHFLYASSSSVYGGNQKIPFKESHNVDHPVSLYAATKKSNELIAHTYSHLFDMPTTGLRFFTVYGPWGRPDMALFKFTKLIMEDEPIRVFNFGKMKRDFTYIDDVIKSIVLLIDNPPNKTKSSKLNDSNPSISWAPYKVFNIGNSKPIDLMVYINEIEKNLNKKASIIFEEMQPGDVETTSANTDSLEEYIGFKPNTSIENGIQKFIKWYLNYYHKYEY